MNVKERQVAECFVDVVLRDPDKSITVCGEGEGPDVERSREHSTVLDNMGECDYDDVTVWSRKEHKYVAWFMFVYGNVEDDNFDSYPIEVISDYSSGEYADSIYNQLEEMTSHD